MAWVLCGGGGLWEGRKDECSGYALYALGLSILSSLMAGAEVPPAGHHAIAKRMRAHQDSSLEPNSLGIEPP